MSREAGRRKRQTINKKTNQISWPSLLLEKTFREKKALTKRRGLFCTAYATERNKLCTDLKTRLTCARPIFLSNPGTTHQHRQGMIRRHEQIRYALSQIR